MLFNQITVVGRLGRDPEMNYTPSGKPVTKLSVAVDQGKNAQGEKAPAMWLNVTCWESLAERVNEKTHKGDEVLVQGRLSVRGYTDKQGQPRQALEVIATSVQLTQYPQSAPAKTDLGSDDVLGDVDDHPF